MNENAKFCVLIPRGNSVSAERFLRRKIFHEGHSLILKRRFRIKNRRYYNSIKKNWMKEKELNLRYFEQKLERSWNQVRPQEHHLVVHEPRPRRNGRLQYNCLFRTLPRLGVPPRDPPRDLAVCIYGDHRACLIHIPFDLRRRHLIFLEPLDVLPVLPT